MIYHLTESGIILAMADTDQAVIDALSDAWTRIQREDMRIPRVVIDIGPGRSSSCSSVGWGVAGSGNQPPVLSLNLRPTGVNLNGREAMEWLAHQAAHAVAGGSAASEGRFHSEAYRQAAEQLGLDVERKTTGGTGWSETSLARGTITRYRPEIDALDRALRKWEPTEQPKARRDSRNLLSAQCSCQPPNRIRVSQSTLDRTTISCSVCGQPFLVNS